MGRSTSIACAAILALSAIAAPAAAATLAPGDIPGGYSKRTDAPTVVGAGITSVTGAIKKNQVFQFVLPDLPNGAQSLTFDFSLDAPIQGKSNGWAYVGAGATVRYSVGSPFLRKNPWDGGQTLGQIKVENKDGGIHLADSLRLDLDKAFQGPLYLGLIFTDSGKGRADFRINAPTNATLTSAVPLPAGAVLLITALLGAGLLGLRRRPRNA